MRDSAGSEGELRTARAGQAAGGRRRIGGTVAFIFGAAALQVICASFFLFDMLATVLGLEITMSWQLREILEISASAGLVLGAVLGVMAVRRSLAHAAAMEDRLRAASGAFHDLVQSRFDLWGLTPAERDVALFAIKGFSTQEIAGFRNTSDGTVKAQSNAIYRKAGVTGRHQLVSLFVEDLLDPPLEVTRG